MNEFDDSKGKKRKKKKPKPKRVGAVTLFKRLGKTVVRVRKNRKTSKKKKHRTPDQKKVNNKFQKMRKLYAAYRAVMEGHPAWKSAAALYGDEGQTGDNYFYVTNHNYVNDGGGVGCFSLFKFCRGELALPWNIRLSRQGNSIALTWHDDRQDSGGHGSDRVLVGLFYDNHPTRPVLFDTGATRAEGCAGILLDPQYGPHAHLYIFFESKDKTTYSENLYFETMES